MKIHAKCKSCNNILLQDHKGPCPVCSEGGKSIYGYQNDEIKFNDSITREFRNEFIKKHPVYYWINIIIVFGSPFVGFLLNPLQGVVVGLFFGILSFYIGPFVLTKIVQITKETS